MSKVRRDTRYDDHYKSIGSVAAIWAKLELNINYAIWNLANLDKEAGACITAQIIAPVPRMRALISLVHYRGGKDDLMKSLNRFSGKLDKLARRRNRIVHDPWSISEATGDMRRMEITADRKLTFQFKLETTDDIDKVYDEIDGAVKEFSKLGRRVFDELPPWPRKQFEQSRGTLRDPPIDSDSEN